MPCPSCFGGASSANFTAPEYAMIERLTVSFISLFPAFLHLFAMHNLPSNIAFQTVLPQTTASEEVFLKLMVALLINGFAQKPTLRTKPNVT